jgi:hypothetical protein
MACLGAVVEAVLLAGSFEKVYEIALWSEVMREFETCQFEIFGVAYGVVSLALLSFGKSAEYQVCL